MSKELTFFELIEKVKNCELKIGQTFKTDYGSILYVGTQNTDNKGENIMLKWHNNNEPVSVTEITVNATYRSIEKYVVINIDEMFKMLLDGEGDYIYYNVRQFSHKQFPDNYFHLSTIQTLKPNNSFNTTSLNTDVRFYKKMF